MVINSQSDSIFVYWISCNNITKHNTRILKNIYSYYKKNKIKYQPSSQNKLRNIIVACLLFCTLRNYKWTVQFISKINLTLKLIIVQIPIADGYKFIVENKYKKESVKFFKTFKPLKLLGTE